MKSRGTGGGGRGKIQRNRNFSTWRQEVSFALRPLYTRYTLAGGDPYS